MEMRLAAGREPALDPDRLRPGKRGPYERSDIRGGVGVIPDVAALIRATCCDIKLQHRKPERLIVALLPQ